MPEDDLKRPFPTPLPIFGEDFERFVTYLREDSSAAISPSRFSLVVHSDGASLDESLKANLNPSLESLAGEDFQGFMLDSLRVIRVGTEVSGSVERAIRWYRRSRIVCFGHKTPQELVFQGRTSDVVGYAKSLTTGWVG